MEPVRRNEFRSSLGPKRTGMMRVAPLITQIVRAKIKNRCTGSAVQDRGTHPKRRYRLGVRTPDSQSGNPGSIPGTATKPFREQGAPIFTKVSSVLGELARSRFPFQLFLQAVRRGTGG